MTNANTPAAPTDADERYALIELDCDPGQHQPHPETGRCLRCGLSVSQPTRTPAPARIAPAAPQSAQAPAPVRTTPPVSPTQQRAPQGAPATPRLMTPADASPTVYEPAELMPAPVFCRCRQELPPSQALPLAQRNERTGVRFCPRCQRPRAPAPRPAPSPVVEPSTAPADFSDVQTSPRQPVALRTEVETTTRTQQQTRTSEVATITSVDGPALRRGDIVAGAAAEGHGVLLGFAGRGEMTRGELCSVLTGAGFPLDWAPIAKSAHAQAGRIILALNSSGYVARYDKSKRATDATYTARWFVARGRGDLQVGGSAATVVLTAILSDSGELMLSFDRANASALALAQSIRKEFIDAMAEETYNATDVSSWLKSTLVARFRAAQLGGTWYVRRQQAVEAEKLLTAFKRHGWGQAWLLPALPVASSDQLRQGIADGFADEVNEVLAEYRERRDEARAERKELSPRTAATIHGKLEALARRCVGFAALLGSAFIEPLRVKCIKASEEVQQSMSGLSIRFGLIFDELREDEEKGRKPSR